MGFLTGKRILIVGLLSKRSIAHGIATAMQREGAALAFTYQNERVKDRIVELAQEFNPVAVLPCDVCIDREIAEVFESLSQQWDGLDAIVHSVGFAPQDQLQGSYIDAVTREGFKIAHDISSYSFSALAKAGLPMLRKRQGSLLTLTYLGSVRTLPSYNVMGVAKASLEANMRYLAYSLGPQGLRVNAISAGPIKTLAATGIRDFRKMESYNQQVAPLRRNVSIEEVGNTAAFLCSDLASGITGEIIHVDSGFHITAMGEFA